MEGDQDIQVIQEKLTSPRKVNGAAGTNEILENVGKWIGRENGSEQKVDDEMNGTAGSDLGAEESQHRQEKDANDKASDMGAANSQPQNSMYELGASNSQPGKFNPKPNTVSPLQAWGRSASTITPETNRTSPMKAWGQSVSAVTPESKKGSPPKSEGQSGIKKSPVKDDAEALSQWWQSRRQGSPRKYHQGLKQTGLLMNSAKTYPIMASPSKKPAPQTSPSPQKGSPRKVLFRHTRGTYLDSLMIVLETVMSQPQDVALLGEEDVAVVERFWGLSLPAQKLYVRLLQRKLDLKRLSKVVYEDVCAPEEMEEVAQELVEAGFLLKGETRLFILVR